MLPLNCWGESDTDQNKNTIYQNARATTVKNITVARKTFSRAMLCRIDHRHFIVNVCMHVYMCVRTYVHNCIIVSPYVCTYVRTYARTHARTHTRTYVCMYVCMHACMYMYVSIYVCMFVFNSKRESL